MNDFYLGNEQPHVTTRSLKHVRSKRDRSKCGFCGNEDFKVVTSDTGRYKVAVCGECNEMWVL